MKAYKPCQGDIVFLDFSPQSGHEQRGRRPAVVVSNESFCKATGLAFVCPITNTDRGFPLHVRLDERMKTTGVIMCEQMKSLDVFVRNISFIEKLPYDILYEVLNITRSFIENEV